jgi:Ca2+-binding EF-hand superfamily protein
MRRATWIGAALGLGLLGNAVHAQTPVGERLRDAFEKLDANADGVLERAEIPDEGLPAFERLLKRGDGNADAKLDATELRALGERARQLAGPAGGGRLAAMDANKDGRISRDEFRGPAPLFDRLDADKDGMLSGKEMRPRAGSRTRPGAATSPRRGAIDRDGDGKVTRDEFRGPATLFDRLDSNGDGILDQSDRRGGAPRSKPGRPDGKPARPRRPT